LSETVDTQSDYNLRKKHGHVSVQLYPRQVDLGDGGRGDEGEGGLRIDRRLKYNL